MGWLSDIKEKLNPSQEFISENYPEENTTTINIYSVIDAYENVGVVGRGVDLIVDSTAPVGYDIKDTITGGGQVSIRPDKLHTLINYKPNPYQSADEFKRHLILDFITEGNMFIYYDGRYLYHLPAHTVEVVSDKKTYIKEYVVGDVKYYPDEVIKISDQSTRSIFRGDSRLKSSLNMINLLQSMYDFHTTLYNNNAIPGMVIKTPDVLSAKIKQRTVDQWSQQYRPKSGGKRPMLLDGGMSLETLGDIHLRELDFNDSIKSYEESIIENIGIPPILLSSGNNANVTPNQKLFYHQTILPICDKIAAGFELFFGYDIKPVLGDIIALQSDLKEKATYYSTLVNTGIMTPLEARDELRLAKLEDDSLCQIRVPANIAGSALPGSPGTENEGAPKEDKE